MRYAASEKLEIIRTVETSHLPVRRTLDKIGIAKSTFYTWLDRYASGGLDALEDPLPDGVYTPAEAAIVRYAQKSTRLEPIDDDLYAELTKHFSKEQLVDMCLTVGLSNMINRFHATFRTDVDDVTMNEAEAGDALHGACPLPRPKTPSR